MCTRFLTENDWIKTHGSGTLKYAKDLSCLYHDMYLHERIAFTFGAHFHPLIMSKTTFGSVKAEPDCHYFTEGCWNIRRRIAENPHLDDKYSGPVWIRVEGGEEGLGIRLIDHRISWLKDKELYCIVSLYKNGNYFGEIRSL